MSAISLRKAISRYETDEGHRYEARFGANQETEAKQFRDQQVERWASILASITNRLPSTPSTSNYAQVVRGFENALRNLDDQLFVLNRDSESGGWLVASSVPLFARDESDIGVEKEDDIWLHVGVVVYWLSKVAIGRNELTVHPSVAFFQDPRVFRGVADAATPDLESARNLVSRARQADALLEASKRDLQSKVEEFDAAIAKTREDGIFKSANALWNEKARRHTLSYSIGFLVIIVLIASGPILISAYHIDTWSLLPKNQQTGEFTYLAALIVALGFVAVAWIFRMLGRFVLDNFTLASDARQREMILRTFLTLVGTPEAGMQEGERVLILNAIFRPVPGQGPDDPAPSSLIDLMKDALRPTGKS
ncbi:DUF6161 domain-containing protein [Bradyrhizobium liaoningense]|uniref:DUF6161 domain-containing protein n=1 Tax=Bradyrhizobium liaoningense TaxID=43992 RepID=UPI001BA81084|nr:DUF6161 domain-containing protein [Bradyrhizobium liaoningense]MBR0983321.1 hypothetical protein [Bradyrhizobium liaoningense]